MILNTLFGFMCLEICSIIAFPLPFSIANNVSTLFFWDGSNKESFIAKRQIFDDNPNRELKQIPLSSLVENLEKNIFASALSLNKALTDDKHITIPEIKLNNESHDVANESQTHRNDEDYMDKANTITTAKSTISFPKNDIVILQTTEKVPQSVNVPAHIIIDRISIQQHKQGVAPIPIFDLEQTKTFKGTKKEDTATAPNNQITLATVTPESPNGVSSSGTSATIEYTTVTTPKNIEQLKEAEEELKEKLAEIEAEPVILSARV